MANTHEDFSRAQHLKSSSNRAFGWLFVTVFLIIALWPLLSGGSMRWWNTEISAKLSHLPVMM